MWAKTRTKVLAWSWNKLFHFNNLSFRTRVCLLYDFKKITNIDITVRAFCVAWANSGMTTLCKFLFLCVRQVTAFISQTKKKSTYVLGSQKKTSNENNNPVICLCSNLMIRNTVVTVIRGCNDIIRWYIYYLINYLLDRQAYWVQWPTRLSTRPNPLAVIFCR